MKKIFLIVAVLVVLFSILFIIGESIGVLDGEYIEKTISSLGDNIAGKILISLAVIFLLVIDILLPVPSSIVMTLSGKLLGFLPGGFVSFVGAMLAAWIGFFACRLGGKKIFIRLIGEKDITRVRIWFEKYGIFAIILSRPVPMLTEILSCLAGLSQVSPLIFTLAAVCGTLPICFVYSYFGQVSSILNPWPAVWVALAIPALGWGVARFLNRKKKGSEVTDKKGEEL
ncbi:MAG: VTT domain-containing protein [Spirochaetales bacterium]|nr:VTT domain-containing protein [Spirochaetales bacterium]